MVAPTRRLPDTLKPSLTLTAGRMVAFAITFLIPIVLARVFSKTGFGTYKQIFLVYSTVFGIAQIGMAESLFYFIPLDRRKAGRYVLNSLAVLAGAGLVTGLALVLAARPIAALLGNPRLVGSMTLLGAFVALTLAAAGVEMVLIARGRWLRAALTYGISDAVKAVLFIVPVAIWGTLDALMAGAVAFAALRFGYTVLVCRAEFAGSLAPDPRLLGTQLAYALPFAAAVVVDVVQKNWHQYVVSHRFDTATFAVYAVGCLQVPLADFLAGPACNVMMVGMRERLNAGDRAGVLALWRDTTAKLAVLIVPLVAVLIVAAPALIVLLFTERYAASVPVFVVWTLITALAVLQVDGVLRTHACTRFLVVLGLVKLAVVAALVVPMIRLLHLPGAAAATLIAAGVARALGMIRVRRLLDATWSELMPWSVLAAVGAATTLAAVAAMAVREALDAPPIASLLAIGATFWLAYALAVGAWLQRRGWNVLEELTRPFRRPIRPEPEENQARCVVSQES